MKLLTLTTLLLIQMIGCSNDDHKEPTFIAVRPENGTLENLSISGKLGEIGETEMYITCFLKDDVQLDQDFLVIKLRRLPQDKHHPAYELLDSMNRVNWAFNMKIDTPGNSWPEDEKEEIRWLRSQEYRIRMRFYNEVIWNIEPEALKTGISNRAYLSYQEYIPPPIPDCDSLIADIKRDIADKKIQIEEGSFFSIACGDSVYKFKSLGAGKPVSQSAIHFNKQ